jgi:hypothetical protein
VIGVLAARCRGPRVLGHRELVAQQFRPVGLDHAGDELIVA